LPWLYAGIRDAGLAVELLETRHVRDAFKAMPVKTDRKDARGLCPPHSLIRLRIAASSNADVLEPDGDRLAVRNYLYPYARVIARALAARGAEGFSVRFAPDSPVEGGVSCELVSEIAKFPASWENTGNFVDSGLSGAWEAAKKDTKSVSYAPIPYASEQGIF
jgi:hypothetical protein